MALAIVPDQREQRAPTLDDLIEDMRDDYLLCRDMGHPWRIVDVKREGGYFVRSLQCGRCTTRRNDSITNGGFVAERRYEYAQQYLLPSAANRADPDRYVSRVDYRREAIRRLWSAHGNGDI